MKAVAYCYNCQKFGHIFTNYFNKNCWKYCGKNHLFQQPCPQGSFSVICNIPGHPSISQECQKYMEKRALRPS